MEFVGITGHTEKSHDTECPLRKLQMAFRVWAGQLTAYASQQVKLSRKALYSTRFG